MTEGTGKGSEGRVSGHRVSFLFAHPQWTLKLAMGHTVFITEGFPIDFHCRQRRWSSRHHLASSSSACRLVLLNKVSRRILRCKRAGYPCVAQARAAEASKPAPPSPTPSPQVCQGLCEGPNAALKAPSWWLLCVLVHPHHGHYGIMHSRVWVCFWCLLSSL